MFYKGTRAEEQRQRRYIGKTVDSEKYKRDYQPVKVKEEDSGRAYNSLDLEGLRTLRKSLLMLKYKELGKNYFVIQFERGLTDTVNGRYSPPATFSKIFLHDIGGATLKGDFEFELKDTGVITVDYKGKPTDYYIDTRINSYVHEVSLLRRGSLEPIEYADIKYKSAEYLLQYGVDKPDLINLVNIARIIKHVKNDSELCYLY